MTKIWWENTSSTGSTGSCWIAAQYRLLWLSSFSTSDHFLTWTGTRTKFSSRLSTVTLFLWITLNPGAIPPRCFSLSKATAEYNYEKMVPETSRWMVVLYFFVLTWRGNPPQEFVNILAGCSPPIHVIAVGEDLGAVPVPIDLHLGLERKVLHQTDVPLVEQSIFRLQRGQRGQRKVKKKKDSTRVEWWGASYPIQTGSHAGTFGRGLYEGAITDDKGSKRRGRWRPFSFNKDEAIRYVLSLFVLGMSRTTRTMNHAFSVTENRPTGSCELLTRWTSEKRFTSNISTSRNSTYSG